MSNPELSTDMTLDAALGTLAETLKPIHEALSHVTREVRPADAAFTRLCKAVRLLQGEVERLRAENAELRNSCDLDNFLELKWFKNREQFMRRVKALYGANIDETDVLQAIDELIEWEKANPKPGVGT